MTNTPNRSNLIGQMIGQYQVVEQIGQGGMATVYKAFQPSMDRYVALKILPDHFAKDPNFVKRFEHEAKAIAALEHPHILPVYDFGRDQELSYMVMRYIQGGTLSSLMGQKLPYRQIVKYVGDVARALNYAHQQGVVHRDIKPSNVLIDKHGEVMLTDFGIAKIMEGASSTQLTATGNLIGTPAYMSPEQAQSTKVDGRSDIYSLGVVLYELLTGQPPYQAETPFAVALKHITEPLAPPRQLRPDLPDAFERVVLKAMAKEPAQRYGTAGEMAEALDLALREADHLGLAGEEAALAPTPARPAPPSGSIPVRQSSASLTAGDVVAPPQHSKRGWLIGGLIAATLLCVAGLGGLLLLAWGARSGEPFAFRATRQAQTANNLDETNTASSRVSLGPTATPTSVPTPTPPPVAVATPVDDPVPAGDDILYAEDFEDDEHSWFIGQESDAYGEYTADVEDGRYRAILVGLGEKGTTAWFEPDALELTDFVYSAEAELQNAEGDYGYGLVFRKSEQGFYLFEIDHDGFFVAQSSEDGEWEVLIEYQATDTIYEDEPNELMVRAVGPDLDFFINGARVGSVEDASLFEGSIALALESYAPDEEIAVDFDNVLVRLP
jgi:serine/threonine protein kinase